MSGFFFGRPIFIRTFLLVRASSCEFARLSCYPSKGTYNLILPGIFTLNTFVVSKFYREIST